MPLQPPILYKADTNSLNTRVIDQSNKWWWFLDKYDSQRTSLARLLQLFLMTNTWKRQKAVTNSRFTYFQLKQLLIFAFLCRWNCSSRVTVRKNGAKTRSRICGTNIWLSKTNNRKMITRMKVARQFLGLSRRSGSTAIAGKCKIGSALLKLQLVKTFEVDSKRSRESVAVC